MAIVPSGITGRALRYFLFCGFVVALRGLGLASLTGGLYPAASVLVDTLLLCALMAVCHAAYSGFQRLIRAAGVTQPGCCFCLKLLFVLVAAFPFLMTGIQLHPQKLLPRRTPEKLGVTFDTTEFAAQGLTLRGWLLNPGGENPPIVFLHGLNANKDNFLLISAEFARRGFPVLTFDFRAHGESDGRLTTFGLQEKNDVAAAVEWLKRRYPGRHILAVGYSLGGAALLQYSAEQFPFDRIVVDATYATLKDTAMDKLFPYAGPLRDPIFGLLSFWAHVWSGENLGSIDNRIAISKLDPAKVLLIHGTSDRMIDYHQSEQLQAATSNKVELWKIKNADHLGTIADPEYMNRVVKFFLDRGP